MNHAPLVIDLDVVGNATDCLGTGYNDTTPPVVNSTPWVSEHPHIKCEVVTLDSELQNSDTVHILSGKILPIQASNYATNAQQAQSKAHAIPIARSCTRLKSLYMSMNHGDGNHTHNKVAHYV